MTRTRRLTVTWSVVVLIVLLVGHAFADYRDVRRKIVVFQEGTNELTQQLVVTLSGSQVVQTLSLINAMAIELPLDGIDEVVEFLLDQSVVAGVYNDLITRVNPILPIPPNEEPQEEIYEWGHEQIGVPTVHQEMPTRTGAGVTVAVLDTGVDSGHSELGGNIVGGYNARPYERSYADEHGHGTHVTGIIAAAANGAGIIGVAPEVNIAAVKVLGADGFGHTSSIIKGFEWVCDQGIRLVNLSLGFSGENRPLEQATQRFKEDCGGVLVAASGNYCSDEPEQTEGADSEGEGCDGSHNAVRAPARYDWVVAVGATTVGGEITAYSLTGLPMRVTGVVTPGGEQAGQQILSTAPGNGFALSSGTSMATAHVTGAAALLLQQEPGLTFEETLALLQQTAYDLGYADTVQGAGETDVPQLMGKFE